MKKSSLHIYSTLSYSGLLIIREFRLFSYELTALIYILYLLLSVALTDLPVRSRSSGGISNLISYLLDKKMKRNINILRTQMKSFSNREFGLLYLLRILLCIYFIYSITLITVQSWLMFKSFLNSEFYKNRS